MSALSAEQRDVAARIFSHLVTPSGTKIAHEELDLVEFAQVDAGRVAPGTGRPRARARSCVRSRTVPSSLRDLPRRPRAADARVARRTRSRPRARGAELESDRRHRQLLAIIGVGAMLLAAMSAVTVYALTQRTEARQQAKNAKANELEANSDAVLKLIELGRFFAAVKRPGSFPVRVPSVRCGGLSWSLAWIGRRRRRALVSGPDALGLGSSG